MPRRMGRTLPTAIIVAFVSLLTIPIATSSIIQDSFHVVSKNIISSAFKSFYLSLKTECAAVCSRTSECTYMLYSRKTSVCQLYRDGVVNQDDGQRKVQIYYRYSGDAAGSERFKIKLHKERKTWDEALKVCQSKGGTLAMPKTKEKQRVIQRTIKRTLGLGLHLQPWIGLKDVDRSNTYRWIDGESLTYTNWYQGEPNRLKERCVINAASYLAWRDGWLDEDCKEKRWFICQ